MKHVGLGVALALVAVVLAPAAKAQGIGSLPDSAGRIFIDGCSFLSPSGSGWSRDPDNGRYFMKTLSKDRDGSHVISVGVTTWPQDEIKDRDELLALTQRDLKAPPDFKILMGSREGIPAPIVILARD